MKLNALMVRYIVNDVDAAVAFSSQHPRDLEGDRNRCATAGDPNRVGGIE